MPYSIICKSSSVSENIKNRYYSSPIEQYPNKPFKPERRINSVKETESFLEEMKKYENEMYNYGINSVRYYTNTSFLIDEFKKDLVDEFKLGDKGTELINIISSFMDKAGYDFYNDEQKIDNTRFLNFYETYSKLANLIK